jgi:hypothetical protein
MTAGGQTNPVANFPRGQQPGYEYRSYTQVLAVASTPTGYDLEVTFDTGSPISLISEDTLKTHWPTASIEFIDNIAIDGVSGSTNTARHVSLPMQFATTKGPLDTTLIAHIVDELPCGLLIGIDNMKPKGVLIDLKHDWLHIQGCRVRSTCLAKRKNKRVPVYATSTTTIPASHLTNLPVYLGRRATKLPHLQRGFTFTPCPRMDLAANTFVSAPRAIILKTSNHLPVSNFGQTPHVIRKGQLLGHIDTIPYSSKNVGVEVCLAMSPSSSSSDQDHAEPMPFEATYPTDEKTIAEADISMDFGSEFAAQIRNILHQHSRLFRPELGMFQDSVRMPIPLKDDDFTGLNCAPYSFSKRDKDAANEILDSLKEQNRVETVPLGEACPIAAPGFIVWRDNKARFVVDMRRLNKKLIPNSYPLPRQDTVLEAMGGSMVFSSMDIRKGFFQQPILESDRWKTTFVTPHRGLERLTVSTMGLATTPSFFQQRMEELLRPYLWESVIVYVDDVIVYSKDTTSHLQHLQKVLGLLSASGVTLQISKCHFGYASIAALGHKVSRLGLTTAEQKIEAITQLDYPTTLSSLESGLGLFSFYRQYCLGYSYIVEPLEALKTRLLRGAPIKGKKRANHCSKTQIELDDDCKDAWDALKHALASAPTRRLPDFSQPFRLYVDGSKQFGFGVALHQLDEEGKERPVLFLSRRLSAAERNFWPTELEVGAVVWAISKLRHYLDGNEFTLYTDHSAIKGLFQSLSPQRRNPRLTSWALFLSQFAGKMTVIHKPGRVHRNADALSRLARKRSAPSSESQSPETSPPVCHLVNVLSMDPQLKRILVRNLPKDRHLGRIYRDLESMLNSPGDPTKNGFKLDSASKLLYMVRGNSERLCIPEAAHKLVLTAAHDHKGHPGIQKTQDRLRRTVYINKLRSLVESYVLACPVCNVTKERKQQPYGQLQPITTPAYPLSVLSMDFITGLPRSKNRNDSLLVVIDKFSKFPRLLPGRSDYTAVEWATVFFDRIYPVWGLPQVIISDRDAKFTSEFWTYLFKRAHVRLGITAAYHPSADGQTERYNAMIECVLRSMLCHCPTESVWEELIPEVQWILSTSINSSTGKTPFELMYGVEPRSEFLNDLRPRIDSAEEFIARRADVRAEAADAVQYAQSRMAYYFDKKHKPVELKGAAYIRLTRRPGHVGYSLEGNTVLSPTKMGPFPIVRRVGNLAYELKLPAELKIHPIISVIHLEQAPNDKFDRAIATTIPEEVHEYKVPFIISKILDKKLLPIGRSDKRKIWHYQVSWDGLSQPSWQPASIVAAQCPQLAEQYETALRLEQKSQQESPTEQAVTQETEQESLTDQAVTQETEHDSPTGDRTYDAANLNISLPITEAASERIRRVEANKRDLERLRPRTRRRS